MLFCLVAVFSCDNRKVCIEADDFGFEDIEKFDVQSFLSPQNPEEDCSYRQEADGFSSINTDLHYCLNGVASGQDHCAESYDGYVAYTETTTETTGITKYCRLINNDDQSELTSGEMSCLNPNDNPFINKGCNIGSTDIPAGPPFIFSSTWGEASGVSASLPAIAEIKANCVNSCVERCRKKKACSHIASRQPIKNGDTNVTLGNIYNIFNPYKGTFPLKHSLDGNLFVASASVRGVDNYVFTWTDSSSELKQMFSQLTNQENRNKLSLAIKTTDDKSILIEDFDSCVFSGDIFTCVIDKNRDLATKDKFSRFFPISPDITLNAVAIFDYVKIGSSAININDRTITTQTQHHFGTNSIVEIISSLAQYKIKVKKILDSKRFIYEEIAGPETINNIVTSCSVVGSNCFLIPSVNVDLQDKFMPSWKATTSKSSATATGGLQISAGSKVEIEATGQITLGSSEEKVCHKNITSYKPNLYEDVSGSCGSNPKIFNFTANTKYQPNVKIIYIPAPLSSKYTLYRSLTTTEKGNITNNNPDYNDLCKSFCYIKITATTSPPVANFACDASVPKIKSDVSTNCKYSGRTITTQYDSAKEQVRIANYAKKVIIDSVATSVEDVNVPSYTPPTLAKPFPLSTSIDIEKTYPYSDLKTKMPPSYNSPLLVYFDNFGNCEINVRIQTDATNFRDVYQDLGRPLKIEGNAINAATSSISSIVYPGATLYLKQTNGNCSNLTITPYPYIEFTAMQSGFIDFKSANTCQLKRTRVVNNNKNYPRRKAKTEDVGTTWKWVQAYNNSYRHNIVPGNSFVDVLLNKIANKIFNIYQSFAASPVVIIPPEGIYNKQGVNDNYRACDTCFATAITKTVVDNTCDAVPSSSGCGGIKSAIIYYASGVLTATPQDGKPGKITITFLDGEELIYNNPGVYHLSFNADRKITKIEAIGGGGGASYDFQSSTANNGGNAKILKIEALSGGVNIISGIDNYYKTENRYTLKIMVGHGGKNSTEINDYRTFSQISHRDSYKYEKDFGYAGGFGDASVVGFVHKTTNKIKILAFAGGGGGGAGRTCNNSIGAFGVSESLKPNQHLLHNATYEYLQNVVQCSVGKKFLKNVFISKLNCDSILSGSPGFCGTGRCSIVGANTASGQSTASSELNHGDRIYCITGYTEALTSPSVALTANCAVASGSGTIVGGSCVINTCNSPSVATGYSNLPTSYNYSSSLAIIPGASCATGYSGTPVYTCNAKSVGSAIQAILSGCAINTCPKLANSTATTHQNYNTTATCNAGYGGNGTQTRTCQADKTWSDSCSDNTCNAVLTSATGLFGTSPTTSASISTGDNLATSNTDLASTLSCGTGYSRTWSGSGTAVCTNLTTNITVGTCVINTCTAPPSPIGYTLPAGFTYKYNYNTTSTAITGVTCASGYSGTANVTYTCNNTTGSTTQATIFTNSGCTINRCTIPVTTGYNYTGGNVNYNSVANQTTTSGVACATGYSASTTPTLTYTCNNTSSSSPISVTSVSGSGCAINQCTIPFPMILGYNYTGTNVDYNGDNFTLLPSFIGCSRASNGYSNSNGGFTGKEEYVKYKCNNTTGTPTQATINASGCFAPCTTSISNGTPTSSFTLNSGTVVWLHNTIATCNSGYSSSLGTTNPTCNNGTWSGSCAINTCPPLDNSTAKTDQNYNSTATCDGSKGFGSSSSTGSDPVCQANGTWSASCRQNSCNVKQIAGYNPLPATVSNTNSTTTDLFSFDPTVSCATGYYSIYGEAKYRCWNTNANGTNIDIYPQTCFLSCGTLDNSNHDAIRGYHGNIAICNGSKGFGSSSPGSHPVCQENGTWSASCRQNSCNVKQIIGYNPLPPTVGNNINSTTTDLFYFDPTVSCATDYYSIYESAVYRCWNTNENGTNIGIYPESCEPKFFEWYAGEFDEGTIQIFYSSGNYNMKYLKVRYGRWWDGCSYKECSKIYNDPETSYGKWTLNVGNGICGDPVPKCGKKAQVWVGYCLRGHCF